MIVKSLLDLDVYKLTVHQIVFHRYNNLTAEYAFTCRNPDKVKLPEYITLAELQAELTALGDLVLTASEHDYLQGLEYISQEYVEYLRCFRLNPSKYLTVSLTQDGKSFEIRTKGPWLAILPFETLVLSTVNELYTRNYAKRQGITHEQLLGESRKRLAVKVQQIKEYSLIHSNKPRIIEFGTRRRWSFEWQREMLQTLLAQLPDTIVGTSNFLLAKELCIRPVGTWGHEFAMGLQGIYPVQHSQREALKVWLREYRGAWGIALTDTLGTGKFLRDFSYELAKGYDGVRHDSGDPIAFTERIIDMYKKYGIDPKSKRLVFSDGLDIRTALDLQERFAERIQVSFGIGTNLTNDTGLIPVPQIVMKMIRSHGQPVVKLSDTPGKISCIDPLVAQYTQHIVDQFC